MVRTLLASTAVFALMATGLAHAAVPDLDFESGVSPFIGFGQFGTDTSYGSFTPLSGGYLGYVEAGATGLWSTLTQSFVAAAGETISFYVGFENVDYLPYDDQARVTLSDGFSITTLFSTSVGALGDFIDNPWTLISYTFSESGAYTLTFGVRNILDSSLSSGLVVDSNPVPGPIAGAGLPLLLGFAGYAAWRRRQGAKAAA